MNKRICVLFLCLLLVSVQGIFACSEVFAAATDGKAQLTTIRAALKSGEISFKVKGDGETTSHLELQLTNKTSHPIRVLIPANEALRPNTPTIQTMLVTRDRLITVPANGTVSADIPTVCAGTKTIKPPPAEGVEFDAGNYPDEAAWKQIAAILEASHLLFKTGAYDHTFFARERRESTIAQLVIWLLLGRKSHNADDQITPAVISADTLSKAGLKPEQLSKEKLQAFNKGIDEIFLAVDMTLKKSKEEAIASNVWLPTDSTLDTYLAVGNRALAKGDFTEGEELLAAAVDEAGKFGDNDPRLATSLVSLGNCYLSQGKGPDAEPFLKRALEIRQKKLGPDVIEVAEVLNDLGMCCKTEGKNKDAQTYFTQALAIREKSLGPNSTLVAASANALGIAMAGNDQFPEAEQQFKRAMVIRYSNLGDGNPDVAETNKNLADLYVREGKFPQAEKLYKKALAIDQKVLGQDDPYLCNIMDGLSEAYKGMNKESDADEMSKQSQAMREKLLGSNATLIAAVPDDHFTLERLAAYNSEQDKMESSVKEIQVSANKTMSTAGLSQINANKPVKDKWALVIGISKFQDPSISLKYAAKDAKDFSEYLVKEENFAQDHVHLLTDEQATRENILAELGDRWLPRAAAPDDLVVIYISSHGSPSKIDVRGTNYLIAYNTDKNSLYATGIPMQDLSKIIKDRVHSDRIVMLLDACHSGAANPTAKGIYRQSNFDAEQIVQGTGQLVICSSEPTQTSWESAKYANGVFTHFLIEGLRKQGDKTPLGNAFQFMKDQVQQEVLRDHGELQTPVLKSRWEGSELLLGIPPAEPRPGFAAPSTAH